MNDIPGDPGASFPANGLSGLFDSLDRLISKLGHRFGTVHRLQHLGLLSPKGIVLALLGLILLFLLPPLLRWATKKCGHLETNFRQQRIPQSYGLVVLLWAATLLGANAYLLVAYHHDDILWLIGIIGFGLLGLLDDTLGARQQNAQQNTQQIKGLRGHFRAALHERKITTGFIKAVGGGLLALALGQQFGSNVLPLTLLNAALIALSANAINLFDLRPGRACGVFLLLALPLTAAALLLAPPGTPPLALVVIPTLVVWPQDANAKAMLGDTGSNLLGASLGMALCAPWIPIPARLVALLLLIGLHILTERVSLTKLIAENPLLRTLDRLTGVREP